MTRDEREPARHRAWSHAYRALLPLLPHGLRTRQGDGMLALFQRELQRSESAGTVAVWRAGVAGLGDLAGRGLYERVCEERRALTPTHVTLLRQLALACLVTCVTLTTVLVARDALRPTAPHAGTAFDIALLAIPFTAALTIPMSVFIAVLWAATRGTVRLVPVTALASAVALCCVVMNAELVPRANLRLQMLFAGNKPVAPTDRSMTLHELLDAQATLTVPGTTRTVVVHGASLPAYGVEIHKKFALAAACVVLALLAAGIGGRVPRLNVWAQVAISIVVFASYYVCIITGEHLADDATVSPAVAMWSANVIVLAGALLALRGARHPLAATPHPTPPATPAAPGC